MISSFWKVHEKRMIAYSAGIKVPLLMSYLKREKRARPDIAKRLEAATYVVLGPVRTVEWYNWVDTKHTLHPAFNLLSGSQLAKIAADHLARISKIMRTNISPGLLDVLPPSRVAGWNKERGIPGIAKLCLLESIAKGRKINPNTVLDLLKDMLFAGVEDMSKQDQKNCAEMVEFLRQEELKAVGIVDKGADEAAMLRWRKKNAEDPGLLKYTRMLALEYWKKNRKHFRQFKSNEVKYRKAMLRAARKHFEQNNVKNWDAKSHCSYITRRQKKAQLLATMKESKWADLSSVGKVSSEDEEDEDGDI